MKRTLPFVAVLAALACTGCIVTVREQDGGEPVHDDGGGEVVVEESPPPRRDNERVVVRERGEPLVGLYKSRYPNLPNLGDTKDFIRGTGRRAQIAKGYMRGKWRCRGPGMFKRGAGKGQTVIDGDLDIKGNGWRITDLTITGSVKIRGDNNDISGCELRRPNLVDIRGNNNRTP